jgi:phosphopantothenoylcysteine decarboxylase/phosphopantothenate--cysteine ligase
MNVPPTTPQRQIVLGVTGSIAAYKAAELTRRLTEAGFGVSVVMTESATRYVGPLTFHALSGNPVATGRFEDLSGDAFQHIYLTRRAELMLVAPCTANVLAKIAHGLADDVLTATVLARDVPLILAPAMNDLMWRNPATQANVAQVMGRGIRVLDVGQGDLACGEVGAGRMMEPSDIVRAVRETLS